MELLTQTIVISVIAGLLWWGFQPRYVFLVRIRQGLPSIARGRVTVQFLQEMSDVLETAGVSTGWVGGVLRGKRIGLKFSRNIPPDCRQRLRNLWPLCR